jgi:outer membrane protein insertion porin family
MRKIIFLTKIFLFILINSVYAEKIEKIIITGNERISTETIIIFAEINLDEDINENKLNLILKNLYKTNYFEDVKISITNNTINVLVSENPIIQSIEIKGIKAKKLKEPIIELLNLKKHSSFTEFAAKKDRDLILNLLKNNGFYFAEVKLTKIENTNKTVNLIYNVELGERAKIKKIKFIGDKKYKNRKLFRIIASEENKFWKFISNKKLLNQHRINLDKKLLEGFYRNKGYYNVKVESSFAQLLDDGQFNLIFNINAGEKFFFNDFKLNIPKDYDRNNFSKIDSIFEELINKPYSYYNLEKILKQIELIALNTEYESISATIEETILENNKINFSIFIDEIQKQYIERINISGNNITRENVIRNRLVLDEGDAFNKILHNKSIN